MTVTQDNAHDALDGVLLQEHMTLSLHELCRACQCDSAWVIRLIEQGALEPVATHSVSAVSEWQFSASCLSRVRSAVRLQRDLGVNAEGVALALDLLEQIDQLRACGGRREE